MAKFKKVLLYILVYIVALVFGSLLASLGEQSESFQFLALSWNFGFDPKEINLQVIALVLGLRLNISVGQIIMVIITVFVSPRIVSKLSGGN